MAVCAGEQILPQTPKSGSHKPVKPLAVSPDFKRVMTAAVDPTSTVADVRAYIRDARIQIRTAQDSFLFAKLLMGITQTLALAVVGYGVLPVEFFLLLFSNLLALEPRTVRGFCVVKLLTIT
jgi:hypothetical protein